jgi:protocatechuate 3,4-dioxygenase alpha subunit
MSSRITTAQTIGPFPHEGWRWAFDAAQAPAGARAIVIEGRVLDGDGNPVSDALIEGWSPSAGAGSVAGLPGLRRAAAGERGEFRFVVPRPSDGLHGEPLLYVTLFARGLLKHQFSAVFLADDPALADAPLLRQVPGERQDTLVAHPAGEGTYLWDIHLQGERETVFLDFE